MTDLRDHDTDDTAPPAAQTAPRRPRREPKSTVSDAALLALARAERDGAIGFANDAELTAAREQALNYFKGVMPDMKALKGRSVAISTDVADAVETLMPNLMDIFTGGEDVAAFTPRGPEDEAAARQETDFVNHVIFDLNDGFLALYSAIKDALLQKTGILKAWREDDEDRQTTELVGLTEIQVKLCLIDGWELASIEPSQQQGELPGPDPLSPQPLRLFDVTLTKTRDCSRVRVMAVPPEDFAVARDVVALAEASYCAMRSRPRAQELIAQGYERDLVDRLPACAATSSEQIALARDTAGEGSVTDFNDTGDMRHVEITEHFIRVLDGDDLVLWRVVTGDDEAVLLERERAPRVPFALLTPYLTPHRLIGRSVADLVVELQRIRTALTRIMLDSGYFALSTRCEINMKQAIEGVTVEDLLDNTPGRPIRSNGGAVEPVQSGQIGFDVFNALEYTKTVVEERTGVVRNAQGLNPDTLHDTASGAAMLMTAAQKRERMIARIFAETGIKDLFLNVHALLREGGSQRATVRLRNAWVDVDPTAWGAREDMDIRIGVGSGGRAAEVALMQQVLMLQQKLLLGGPATAGMVSRQNLYNAADQALQRAGVRDPERYITDPATLPPPGAGATAGPPPPDPEMVKVQLDAQHRQAAQQQELQLGQYKIDTETQLKREQMQLEAELKRQQMALDAQLRMTPPPVRFGGETG